MSFITGSNTIIKENLLVKDTIRLLDKKFVVMPWANTMYEGEIKQKGDTVSVTTFPNISWSSGTTAGADISATTFTITKETIQADQLAQLRVEVTNVEEIQSNLALREQVADRFSYGQAELLEKFLISLIVPGVNASNKLGAIATALTSSTVIDAVESMRVALSAFNAYEPQALFVKPGIASLMRKSTWFDGFREGLDVRRNGYIGKFSNFEVYETNNNSYSCMFAIDKQSVHFVAQFTGFKVTEAPNGFRHNILAELVYGGKVFTENAKRIAVYYHA